mmetsp:Transcript_33121/g.32248  ORF Transcript_33121/g.32248 Transcript_33121/m.32248 type:complete len:170 (+) Transcript_33121:659-1168(+)
MIIQIAFIFIIYVQRMIQEQFSMSLELKLILGTVYMFNFVYYFFILYAPDNKFVTTNAVDYLSVACGLICLYITAVIPLRQSYSPNTIIPFPLNEECIKSLEMALLMNTSANYFYCYLENYCMDKDALLYFGLYADLRSLMRMCEEGEDETLVIKQADCLFKDYVIEER